MENSKLRHIINIIREEMTATGGNLAGLPPDQPPVDLRKGKRRNWNPFFKNLAKMQRRKPQP
jgi:prolyl-tRNA synthetase